MSLRHLQLADFRIFAAAELEPDPDGTTVITGPNGAGKTSVLEAVAYLGLQRSFRTASREAMIRNGADRAIVRAELDQGDRAVLVEAEISAGGRSRTQVNRQPARSRRETADAVYLKTAERTEVRVPRASVDSIAPGRQSIMPQGLEGKMNRDELRDLIAFLKSLK